MASRQRLTASSARKLPNGNQSLNRVILDELTLAATGGNRKADFCDIVGRWTPDPAFDEMVAAQRQIDQDLWK